MKLTTKSKSDIKRELEMVAGRRALFKEQLLNTLDGNHKGVPLLEELVPNLELTFLVSEDVSVMAWRKGGGATGELVLVHREPINDFASDLLITQLLLLN